MNITRENLTDLTANVSIAISSDDYAQDLKSTLNKYRQKANIPGFRPGKVPASMIQKMYGQSVLVEAVNKLVSENMQNYFKENNLNVLGDPIPQATDDNVWEIGKDFSFTFEVAYAPSFEVEISANDALTRYTIKADKAAVEADVDNYQRRFGEFVVGESVTEFDELLVGAISELDNTEGHHNPEARISMSVIKDEKLREPFKNAKAGDVISFDLAATFPNDWEIASILGKKNKEEVGDITGKTFQLTVTEVKVFRKAELNEDLFAKVFPENTPSTEEAFRALVEEQLVASYKESTDVKFILDTREHLIKKTDLALPEDFLRRWLKSVQKEGLTDEQFEQEFPSFLRSMRWELVCQNIAKKQGLEVKEEDLIEQAKRNTRRQFASYGISNVPEDALASYAMNALKDERNVRQMISQIMDKKVADYVEANATVAPKEISLEEYNKMLSEAAEA